MIKVFFSVPRLQKSLGLCCHLNNYMNGGIEKKIVACASFTDTKKQTATDWIAKVCRLKCMLLEAK